MNKNTEEIQKFIFLRGCIVTSKCKVEMFVHLIHPSPNGGVEKVVGAFG